jgi:hypothetical protein
MFPAHADCYQYEAKIAHLQQQEKVIVQKANRTNRRGDLMALAEKYRYINHKLGFTIQSQQDCYIMNGNSHKTDSHWAQYNPNGYPGIQGGW